MLLEHSLGRSVGCCDVWRVILAQTVKNLPASTRNLGLISGSGRCPGEGNGNPLQYSFLAWRISWTDEPGRIYSPWGHKELDTTERLTVFCFFFSRQFLSSKPQSSLQNKLQASEYFGSPTLAKASVNQLVRCCIGQIQIKRLDLPTIP